MQNPSRNTYISQPRHLVHLHLPTTLLWEVRRKTVWGINLIKLQSPLHYRPMVFTVLIVDKLLSSDALQLPDNTEINYSLISAGTFAVSFKKLVACANANCGGKMPCGVDIGSVREAIISNEQCASQQRWHLVQVMCHPELWFNWCPLCKGNLAFRNR